MLSSVCYVGGGWIDSRLSPSFYPTTVSKFAKFIWLAVVVVVVVVSLNAEGMDRRCGPLGPDQQATSPPTPPTDHPGVLGGQFRVSDGVRTERERGEWNVGSNIRINGL